VRSEKNPLAIRSHHQHRRLSISLWAGILGDYLMGPHILLALVSGCDCLKFLRAQLSGLLEYVSINARLHIWFRRNCSSLRYSREVPQWMS
jgi:hypothetical protein